MAESILEALVTDADLAALVGVTPRRIRQFQEAGKLARVGRNRYRLADAMPVLVEELGEGGDKASELQIERVRKLRADASLAELELAKAKELVAPVDEFQKVWESFCTVLRINMTNIPQRVVTSLLGETDETRFKDVLLDEIKLALNAAADSKLDDEIPENEQ